MIRSLIANKSQFVLGQHLFRCTINTGAMCASTHKLDETVEEFNNEMEQLFGASQDSSQEPSPPRSGQPTVSTTTPSDRQSPARLTHVDESGRASMVDVSSKGATKRTATAAARVLLGQDVYNLVADNKLAKGDVLTVAQIAGIQGAKHTSTLIPLCHPLYLSSVKVDLQLEPIEYAIDIIATATTIGQTGVEMEALTAASVSALTVYDMVKAASKSVEITGIKLLAKSGGKSGDYVRGVME